MPSIWKMIILMFISLLAGGLSACQSLTPSPSPVPPSATVAPILTPSVGRIAFYSTTGPGGTGKNDIYLINADGSDLIHASKGWTPYWSPDGQQIAFGGGWVMKADGSEQQLFIEGRSGGSPPLAWSPDGKKIAFATRRGDFVGSIYIVDVKTALSGDKKGGLKQLIKQAVDAYDLAWSPDGRQLLFSYHKDEDSPQQIAILDVAAAASEPNERGKWQVLGEGRSPMWSPDGKKVVYEFENNIYSMEADGSNKKQLTLAGGITPVWSPDGQKIAFQSVRDGNFEIYVMSADGSNQMNITNNPASDYSPLPTALSWSPDSKQIAFISKRDGNQEIYVIDADGSHLLRLTNNDVDDWGPVWQPQPKP